MENDFSNEELEGALKRAFVDKKADCIIVDGHSLRSRFLRESLKYGIDNDLLSEGDNINEDRVFGRGLGQYLAYTYQLTSKGKEHFKIGA